jgi:hypothetical protein
MIVLPAASQQQRASVLRTFLAPDGRLRSMPRAGRKRQIVLEHVVTAFEPGRRYPEPEVDAILRSFHDDYPALRRYLVDAALLARERGEYWRIGGWVDVT